MIYQDKIEKEKDKTKILPDKNQWISDFIKNHLPSYRRYYKGNIPKRMLYRAQVSFAKGMDLNAVFFLIDTTVLGTTRKGIVITEQGIYWSPKGVKGGRFLPYSQLPEASFTKTTLFIGNDSIEVYEDRLLPHITHFVNTAREHFTKEWYVQLGEQCLGPYSVSEVRDLITEGKVNLANFLAFKQDMDKKRPLSEISELGGQPASVIPQKSVAVDHPEKTLSVEPGLTEPDAREEKDFLGEFSWQTCQINEGLITFECLDCKKQHTLNVSVFTSWSDELDGLLSPTDREMSITTAPRAILYNIPAFLIALVVGGILAESQGGKIPSWIPLICVAICIGLAKVFKQMWSKRKLIPVWVLFCKGCGKRNFMASDGRAAAIGDLQPASGNK